MSKLRIRTYESEYTRTVTLQILIDIKKNNEKPRVLHHRRTYFTQVCYEVDCLTNAIS